MSSVYASKPWLATYPAWLPPAIEAPPRSVLDVFLAATDAAPTHPCIHYFDHTLSYGEVERQAKALAAGLKGLGVAPGDRVIVVMQNIPQAVVAVLAIWMRGAVAVPLNPMYTGQDLAHYLADCKARMVVCQDDLYPERVQSAVAGHPEITVITTSPLDLLSGDGPRPSQFEGLAPQRFEGTHDLMEIVASNDAETIGNDVPQPDALAYLVYTSGTTGPAKGAMIRHASVLHNAMVYAHACRLESSDVVLAVAPFFHITGIVAHQAIAFCLGAPMILAARFDAGETLRLIAKYRATFTVAAITVYIAMLNSPQLRAHDISCFEKAYSGGAPVSPSTVQRFREEMGLTIYNVYGLTESCSPATITPLGMEGPVDETSGALSVGLIIPGHEAWIVDLENSEHEMPIGEEGELVLRGPGITGGYWERPAETANAIRDGRFFTGDVAKIDVDGWCYIVDRKKDLIIASGYKVWPREVEDVLYRHPAVREAAVVGIPDDYRGETVKAFVSLAREYAGRVTAEELIAFCKANLAAYKYPRQVEIIDEVPKTLTGKMLRRQLKDK